ncbi:MAG: DUF4159 domain-containing protein [Phycisphaerae bacterium]|nr:DUF4159 domain-containing protein [Phycisphaerae bacterium]
MDKKHIISFMAFLFLVGYGSKLYADENDWMIYLGDQTAKKAPRKSVSAAEALAPLPLPATPLRRTERKTPPQPDYLIGKVIWGKDATFTDSSGDKLKIADWNLCPTDLERFIDNARKLQLPYHWCNINLGDFHYDPQQLPSLLFSGVRTVRLSPEQNKALRQYVLNGGMIIFDSIAGSPYFNSSAIKLTGEIFPECQIRDIPADHPLYHIFFDLEKVSVKGQAASLPKLQGIYVGSRVAILISPVGLGCGWNRNISRVETLKQASYYDQQTAAKIGLNIAGYIVGYAEAGVVEGRPEIFGLADKTPTDEFVFAQIKHEGSWNVHPGAASALLMKMRKNTSVTVNLKRAAVDLDKDDISVYPFLYMTGLDDFKLSEKGVGRLKQFINNGGVLLINNGLGLSSFDIAVRRELKKVIGDSQLQKIPIDHPLYNCLFQIDKANYSPALQKEKLTVPSLMGLSVGGKLAVIYSPYDLEAGWLEVYYPLIRSYQPLSSQKIAMNIIMYLMTQ